MDEQELKALVGVRWVHSHEEDHGDELVFRPSNHDFPLSRGRRSFELQPDGNLSAVMPGPADRGRSYGGRWSVVDDQLTLTPAAARDEVLRIKKVEPDRLVVERTH
jgi:hypothetical protein